MTGSPHTDVAAYVLGVLSEAESTQFEAHLMNCPHCQLDLIELYQLPDVLDLVKRSWPEPPMPAPGTRTLAPGPRVLRGLMEEASVKRRRRRRVGILSGIAAASLVVAGPLVTLAVRPADAVPPSLASASTKPAPAANSSGPPASAPSSLTATTPSGGSQGFGGKGTGGSAVTAQVVVTPKDWGSQVELELRGIVGPMVCRLVAISNAGEPSPVNSWHVPAKGYGIASQPEPLRLSGTTDLPTDQISRFEVRAGDGSLLVTVTP